MPWVRRGYINPPWKGGVSLEHTRSAPEGAITICAAAALAHGCRMRVVRRPRPSCFEDPNA